MQIVWIAFSLTALILALAAMAALKAGKTSSTLRIVGRALLVMALGTAVFPSFLPLLGVQVWAFAYGFFVLLVTGFLTGLTAMDARCKDRQGT